jgi:hypothetical protein
MNNIDSYINEGKAIVARLLKREADLTSAKNKRNACRYNLFEAILDLDKPLRKMGKPKQVKNALKARYGTRQTTSLDPAMVALRQVYPTLDSKKCSKYAAALRFVRRNKKQGESVKEFMKAHGGIKGCAEKDKKSRSQTHAQHKKK